MGKGSSETWEWREATGTQESGPTRRQSALPCPSGLQSVEDRLFSVGLGLGQRTGTGNTKVRTI